MKLQQFCQVTTSQIYKFTFKTVHFATLPQTKLIFIWRVRLSFDLSYVNLEAVFSAQFPIIFRAVVYDDTTPSNYFVSDSTSAAMLRLAIRTF